MQVGGQEELQSRDGPSVARGGFGRSPHSPTSPAAWGGHFGANHRAPGSSLRCAKCPRDGSSAGFCFDGTRMKKAVMR